MPGKKTSGFTLKDYITLGVALSLAFVVWMISNLSNKYSEVVSFNIVAVSDMDGRANIADRPARLVARCQMKGFDILYYKLFSDYDIQVKFNRNELAYLGGTRYYVLASNMLSHSHEIFRDNARCEYFVTDTLFFDFQTVDFKKVPVNLVSKIEFEAQYMPTGPIVFHPDSVLVSGPGEQLEQLDHINTRPLALEALNSDSIGELLLEVPSGIHTNIPVVEYHLFVCRYVEETISVPVEVTGVPDGVSLAVTPSVAQLALRFPFPTETGIADGIKVVVSYQDFEKSISGRCIGKLMDLPSEVLSAHLSPEIFDCVQQKK